MTSRRIIGLEVPFVAFAWVVLAVGLVAWELHHLAFYAAFGAIGAAAAALVAVFAPSAIALQIAVAVVTAAIGVFAVRPLVSDVLPSRRVGATVRGVHGGLIGATGVTLDEVGLDGGGHVRILGESWLAVAADHEPIAQSQRVLVVNVVGTTLTVRALDDFWELT